MAATAILLSAAFQARADFVRSSVSLGGYYIDAQDAPHDGNLYQNDRIQVNALKNGVGLNVAYGYSDLYDKRPNTYATANRLALANLTYDPPVAGLSVKLGRDFQSLHDRSLFYDGGQLKYAYKGLVQAELFGGFGVPTFYEDNIVSFDGDKGIIGGKLTVSPIQSLVIAADGLVYGKQDDGTLGLTVQETPVDWVALTAGTVYRLDSSLISHAEVGALLQVRARDELQVRYTRDESTIDSSRYYDYFINPDHQTFLIGYALRPNGIVRVAADYGMVMYDDEIGYLVSLKASACGFYAGASKEWESITDALDLNVGYSNVFAKRWMLNASYGYSLYDLNGNKLDKSAHSFTLNPGIQFRGGLQLGVGYEFLNNNMYKYDNRFFVSLKHSYFKGLSQ